jgi:hypothetical protein
MKERQAHSATAPTRQNRASSLNISPQQERSLKAMSVLLRISPQQIHDTLLGEARSQLQRVKDELANLELQFRTAQMVSFAAIGSNIQDHTILTENERRSLHDFNRDLGKLKADKSFWERRLNALQNYDPQHFQEEFKEILDSE